MGMISINVPGDMKLDYKIENSETVEKIIKIIKNAGVKKRVKRKDADIVGIWKDRFDERLSSEEIQKQWREKNWDRY